MRYFQRLERVFICVLLVVGCDATHLSDEPLDRALINLCQPAEVEAVVGYYEEKFSPATAPAKAFDARKAQFLNKDVKWSMINLEGDPAHTGMCWIGGLVYTNKPWNSSWDDHEDLEGPTRNGAAISVASTDIKVAGLHYFNVHDGVRTSDAFDWVIASSWGEYVRDDCIENDHLHSGRVSDSLFDGCYAGISTKPSEQDVTSHGAGELVEMDSVLLRLQAMPYPFKLESKDGVIDANGNPYADSGTPYGHGDFFKLTDIDRNPHFSITNSTFLATHLTAASKFDFPPESLIDQCRNNTVIWLGPGAFPGKLPTGKFPGCVEVVTGQAGQDLWKQKVTDWHERHPEVGANRKPSFPGDLAFPKIF